MKITKDQELNDSIDYWGWHGFTIMTVENNPNIYEEVLIDEYWALS